MPTFGERLRKVRREQFVKQKDIAKHLNIAVSTLSQYENNKRHPSFDLLIKITDYLNVSTDYLLGVENKGKTTISKNINIIDEHIEGHSCSELLEDITDQLASLIQQEDLKSYEIFQELYRAIATIQVEKNYSDDFNSIEDMLSQHLTHKEIIDQRLNKLFRHHIKNYTLHASKNII